MSERTLKELTLNLNKPEGLIRESPKRRKCYGKLSVVNQNGCANVQMKRK
jgi:hypothetical protein